MIPILTENLESDEELDPQSAHLHRGGWTGLMGQRSHVQTTSSEVSMSGLHGLDSRVALPQLLLRTVRNSYSYTSI